MMTKDVRHKDYVALRHFNPEAVRLVRGILDNGGNPSFKKNVHGEQADNAIAFMRYNPEAGRVRWIGSTYQFIELEGGF